MTQQERRRPRTGAAGGQARSPTQAAASTARISSAISPWFSNAVLNAVTTV